MSRRRISVELVLEARNYLSEGRQVALTTKAAATEVDRLGDQTDGTSRDMAELAANTDVAKHEIDRFGDKTRGSTRDLRGFERELHGAVRAVGEMDLAMMLLARRRPRGAGDGFGGLGSLAVSGAELGTEAVAAGVRLGSSTAGGAVSTPVLGPVLVAGILEAVVLASPMIGATLGGAIGGAAGTGALAAGIFSASKDPRVQLAAQQAGTTIANDFFGGGHAFVGPTIKALDILTRAEANMHIGTSLAKVAPLVTVIASGLADAGERFVPGFNKALDRMGPLAEVAANGLSDAGGALGGLLDDITASKGTVEGLETLFGILNGTIRLTGRTLEWLGNGFHRFNVIEAKVFGALEDFPLLPDGVRGGYSRLNDILERLTGTGENVHGVMTRIANTEAVNKVWEQQAADADALAKALSSATQELLAFHAAQLDAAAAGDQWEADLDNLAESVDRNGHSLDQHTEKGRANRAMLRELAEDAMRTRDANIANGMSVADANIKYQQQLQDLLKDATQLGFNTAAVWALIGAYNNVPRTITTQFIQEFTSRGVPMGEHSGFRIGDTQGRAAGGPVLPGQSYVVGEQGAELLTMGANGGWVTPAGGWQSSGSSSQTIVIENHISLTDPVTGRVMRQMLVTDGLNRGVPQATVSAAYP